MNTTLDYTLLEAGYCLHHECMTIRGGRWCKQPYPALCALITHPTHGYILFDTGYTSRFYEETQTWPSLLYRKLLPPILSPGRTLVEQLSARTIYPEQINYVVLSHFHADHIAGVKDFPHARFICSKRDYKEVKSKKGFHALRRGYVQGLLPDNFEQRILFVEDKPLIPLLPRLSPFEEGMDILGDQSLIAVTLAGHTAGQIGVVFQDPTKRDVFLVGDSCWSSKAFQEYRLPSRLSYLIHHNKSYYDANLYKLHSLYQKNKDIFIVPSHCQEIWMHHIKERSHA